LGNETVFFGGLRTERTGSETWKRRKGMEKNWVVKLEIGGGCTISEQ